MEGCGEVRRIHIVYFLCRNGKIEQPHLIQVHHLNRHGVRLRDVKRWVSELRGEDMAECYAWSYKRMYRGGYVWQDLTDDDLITAISDNEYVLKGSLLPSFTTEPFYCEQRKSLSKQHADAREEKPKIMVEVQKIPNETRHTGDSISHQCSRIEGMGSKASITLPGLWQRSSAAEKKKKKKKKKMETELIKSDGNGWKPTKAMRNFIGCQTVETKGSGIRVVRRQEVTREAAV